MGSASPLSSCSPCSSLSPQLARDQCGVIRLHVEMGCGEILVVDISGEWQKLRSGVEN